MSQQIRHYRHQGKIHLCYVTAQGCRSECGRSIPDIPANEVLPANHPEPERCLYCFLSDREIARELQTPKFMRPIGPIEEQIYSDAIKAKSDWIAALRNHREYLNAQDNSPGYSKVVIPDDYPYPLIRQSRTEPQ